VGAAEEVGVGTAVLAALLVDPSSPGYPPAD